VIAEVKEAAKMQTLAILAIPQATRNIKYLATKHLAAI
jgi:hypothetical protein